MTTIEKIKAEIKRRYKEFDGKTGDIATASRLAYLDVISFLSTLESEKPVPNDLEEAAGEYAEEHGFRVPYDGSDNFYDDVDVKASKEGFIAGAKWQYQKDRAEFAKLKAKEWSDGYDEGIAKGKEQMIKEAVCYIAQPDITATGNIVIPFIRIGYTALSRYGIKVGDKVRIIIVKE